MGGVAIGVQASPEISSLVVGSVRIVIDLALRFTLYFRKLTDMICAFEDYLDPLAEYAKAADISLVEKAVVNAYANLIDFSWKARRVFIDATGDERKWKSLRAFMRQHWETFELEFETIKDEMQGHLEVLKFSVQSIHFNFDREKELARQRDEERKEKTKFLKWLSNTDFEKTHQDTFAKKVDDTCDWLIQQPKYQEWLNASASSLLWCHGKPGIGKSVLASNVIEDITRRVGLREDAALCFAYYDYRNEQLKDLHEILASLIKQICRRRALVPPQLLQIEQDAYPQSLIGTQENFISLIEELSEVYVVFDALDECPEQERGYVLQFITRITTAQVPCKIRVFVTSRKEMDIEKAFTDESVPFISILAENVTADIETYTRSQVARLRAGVYGRTLYINDDTLQEKIIQTLVSKAAGMFLWVNLQLDSLCQASKAHKDAVVETALEALPQGLPNTYARILDRIEAQTPYMKELALNCLAWTIHSKRPLKTWELQDALAIHSVDTSTQDLQIDSPPVILEACGNLLEEVGNNIRPIHYTVQEYLTTTVQEKSPHGIEAQLFDSRAMHTRLGSACLRYIQQTVIKESSCGIISDIELLRKHRFIVYAIQNFDFHIRRCEELSLEILNGVEDMLQQDNAALTAIMRIKSYQFRDYHTLATPSTIVYSSYLYDIPTIRQKWSDRTPPRYALHLAASSGLPSAVARLLEAGYDIDEVDQQGKTALCYACQRGNLETAQILIRRQADIDKASPEHGNPLQVSSRLGMEQAVILLLNSGACINAQGGRYGSALQASSYYGYDNTVRILLDRGANVNLQGGLFGNALQAASGGRHEQVVRTLLEGGADANAQGGRYGNALQAASYAGSEQVVRVLLDEKVDVNAHLEASEYGYALLAASSGGYERVVEILLAAGADVNAHDEKHGSALHVASAGGTQEVETVKILIASGAEVNAQGGKYGSAIQAASCRGHEQIVRVLLDAGAEINIRGGEFGTALQAASYKGNKQIVQILLAAGAKVNMQGGKYGSALHAASDEGEEEVVKALIAGGADVNADVEVHVDKENKSFGSALLAASRRGREKVVQILLDAGAEVNARGEEYDSALHAVANAAKWHHSVEVVKILVASGADVNARYGSLGSVIQAASRKGRKEMVQILLDAGAQDDREATDYPLPSSDEEESSSDEEAS